MYASIGKERAIDRFGDERRARRGPKGLALGLGGMAVTVTLLVLLAPVSAAGAVHAASTFTTPFGGQTDISSSAGSNGCGRASIATPPAFNLSTGVGTGVITSSTANCPPNLNGNLGAASAQMGLASSNFTTTTSGVHHVTAKWSLHWKFAIKTVEPTGKGYTEAYGTVSISLLVLDATNSSELNHTSWFAQHILVGNGSVATSGSANRTLTLTVSLVAGHPYIVYVYAFISAFTTVSSSPGGTATSKVDLGSGLNKATLHSYTVS